eukprot:g7863.t1
MESTSLLNGKPSGAQYFKTIVVITWIWSAALTVALSALFYKQFVTPSTTVASDAMYEAVVVMEMAKKGSEKKKTGPPRTTTTSTTTPASTTTLASTTSARQLFCSQENCYRVAYDKAGYLYFGDPTGGATVQMATCNSFGPTSNPAVP